MLFETEAKKYNNPEKMAEAYLVKYFENKKIKYPINPFQMLKDEGFLLHMNYVIIFVMQISTMTADWKG